MWGNDHNGMLSGKAACKMHTYLDLSCVLWHVHLFKIYLFAERPGIRIWWIQVSGSHWVILLPSGASFQCLETLLIVVLWRGGTAGTDQAEQECLGCSAPKMHRIAPPTPKKESSSQTRQQRWLRNPALSSHLHSVSNLSKSPYPLFLLSLSFWLPSFLFPTFIETLVYARHYYKHFLCIN